MLTFLMSSSIAESKCPELLANYCDMLLRKTPLSKKLTSDEVEAKLKDVLLVLKYVQVRAKFSLEFSFRFGLASRLIHCAHGHQLILGLYY